MSSVIIRVRVTPRGGRDAVIGVRDGTLYLRVAAPPVAGAANRACVALVAGALGVPRSRVTLAGGAASREKRFSVTEISREEAERRLGALPTLPAT